MHGKHSNQWIRVLLSSQSIAHGDGLAIVALSCTAYCAEHDRLDVIASDELSSCLLRFVDVNIIGVVVDGAFAGVTFSVRRHGPWIREALSSAGGDGVERLHGPFMPTALLVVCACCAMIGTDLTGDGLRSAFRSC